MYIFLILILLILILIVIFAFQNAAAVPLHLFFWKIESSLSLVLVVTLSLGALLSILFSLAGKRKRLNLIKEQEEKIKWLEEKLFDLSKNNQISNDDFNMKNEYENKSEYKES